MFEVKIDVSKNYIFIRIFESILGKMQFSKNAREIGLQVVEVSNYEEAIRLV